MVKKKMTFEEAVAGLEQIVRQLEDGQLPLEKSLELFSEGIKLSKFCQSSLEEAEQRIMVLTAQEGLKEFDT
ncbi:MAG: exodeoxyribonuclease VII small subunit [Desulfocucumaceae bacterium]